MSQRKPNRPKPLLRALKKYSVSAFVVCSFAAYAVHERAISADASGAAADAPSAAATREVPLPPTLTPAAGQIAQAAPGVTPSPIRIAAPTDTPAPMLPPPAPTSPPTAAPVANGAFKDGVYTGPVVDAYFGNVQVQATIQHGQLADVKFLDYPHHRRTSVRISNYAMPYLTSEAIQAQSARVNIISGATLTSEAFAQSLQVALTQAHA